MDSSLNIRGVASVAAPPATGSRANAAGKASPQDGQKLPGAAAPPPTPERVDEAVRQIQSYLNDSNRELQFQVDKASGQTVIRVVNPETHEVIRQMPSEEVLKLAASMSAQGGHVISELV